MSVIRPVITEKSMRDAATGHFTFSVDQKETKRSITALITKLYGVNVIGVHTIMERGKTRRVGKKMRFKELSDRKKAIVELAQGQTIEAFQIGGQDEGKK